jgi:hypothetical protein
LIAADLFADDLERDPRETFARVSGALSKLSEAGRIVRYTVEGTAYLEVTNWDKHQRIDKPNKARYPRSTSEDADIRESVAEPSRDSSEIPAPGTEEQGSRGTGEKELASQAPPKPKAARGQHLPENWRPNDSTIEWAKTTYPLIDHRLEFEKFCNHWHASSGQNARKRNWDMAFRNWLMNAKPALHVVNGSPMATSDLRVMQTQALKQQPVTRLELE